MIMQSVVDRVIKIWDVVWATVLVFYYMLESVILSVFPRRLWNKDVSSETVLITGAGSGIGRELALKFAELSPKLVLLDINVENLKKTVALIRESVSPRCSVYWYECDISEPDDVYATAEKIQEEAGRVTMLINNAGVVEGKSFLQLSEEAITKTIAVNCLAHFWICKAFLPSMIDAKHGHIVTIASLAGFYSLPKLTDYCASKAGAVGFTESLRYELAADGHDYIKLTLVAPAHVSTKLFKGFSCAIGSCTPERAASEIVSGILSDKTFLTIPNYLSLAFFLSPFYPDKAMKVLYKIFGLMECMNHFKKEAEEKEVPIENNGNSK